MDSSAFNGFGEQIARAFYIFLAIVITVALGVGYLIGHYL